MYIIYIHGTAVRPGTCMTLASTFSWLPLVLYMIAYIIQACSVSNLCLRYPRSSVLWYICHCLVDVVSGQM